MQYMFAGYWNKVKLLINRYICKGKFAIIGIKQDD